MACNSSIRSTHPQTPSLLLPEKSAGCRYLLSRTSLGGSCAVVPISERTVNRWDALRHHLRISTKIVTGKREGVLMASEWSYSEAGGSVTEINRRIVCLSFDSSSMPVRSSDSPCFPSSIFCSSDSLAKLCRSSRTFSPTSRDRSHGSAVPSNFNRKVVSLNPLTRCTSHASYAFLP